MNVQGTGPMPAPEPETVAAFIRRLQRNGVRLSVTGEPGRARLRVVAPAGRLSEEDRERLGQWRPRIINALAGKRPPEGLDADPGTGSPAGDTDDAHKTPLQQIGQIGQIPALGAEGDAREPDACPRCARLDEAARQVLAQLQASPSLPPALRSLSPERLSLLLKWSIVALTNPRPQWPPSRPSEAQRKHRAGLAGAIEALGGHASGAEPAAEDAIEDTDADD